MAANQISLPLWKRRFSLLKFTLFIVAFDYVAAGMVALFMPWVAQLPPVSTTPLAGFFSIMVGLFTFFISRKPDLYEKLIWVVVFQEAAVSALMFYLLFSKRVLAVEAPTVYIHLAFLAALGFLMVWKGKFPQTSAAIA